MSAPPHDIHDILIVEGVNAQGFGTIPRMVMRDPGLTPEAKAIYAYIASFAGSGETAFPGVDTMMSELGIGRARFYKHRKLLVDAGYLTVRKGRREGSSYANNVYVLNAHVAPRAERVRERMGQRPDERASAVGDDCGKPEKPQVDEQFDFGTVQNGALACDSGKPRSEVAKPQVDEQFDFGTVQNRTANNRDIRSSNSSSSHSPIPLQPSIRRAGGAKRLGDLLPESLPRRAGADGRTDDARIEGAEAAYARLCDSAVNRNLIRQSRPAYDALVEAGYFPAEIARAWDARQAEARRANRASRFFPQLKRFLADDGPDGAAARIECMRRSASAVRAEGASAPSWAQVMTRDGEFARCYMALVDRQRDLRAVGTDEREAAALVAPLRDAAWAAYERATGISRREAEGVSADA